MIGTLNDENGVQFKIAGWVKVGKNGRMTSISGQLQNATEFKHEGLRKKTDAIGKQEIVEKGTKAKKYKPVKWDKVKNDEPINDTDVPGIPKF